MFFMFCRREYIKIFDGNGTEVFYLQGWASSFHKRFTNISFGEYKNITIQVFLSQMWSNVKIDFGTLNQGLDSGKQGKKTNLVLMDARYVSPYLTEVHGNFLEGRKETNSYYKK